MILLINICKEEMHYLEFVKPVQDIVKAEGLKCVVKHYTQIDDAAIESAEKIIICGTSLADFGYLKRIDAFDFLKTIKKPVLAICGGMQILCMQFGCRLGDGTEIGLKSINFEKEFLGISGERDVYCLHNKMIIEDENLKQFEIFSRTGAIQAIKHKTRPLYAVLFHPEVRNKDLIRNFVNS